MAHVGSRGRWAHPFTALWAESGHMKVTAVICICKAKAGDHICVYHMADVPYVVLQTSEFSAVQTRSRPGGRARDVRMRIPFPLRNPLI